MRVRGFGIDADLPSGWEGAVRSAPPLPDDDLSLDVSPDVSPSDDPSDEASPETSDAPEGGGQARTQSVVAAVPVLHAGTFPLPTDRGDFGSGAVETMRDGDTFVALVEYDRDEADTPLFEAQGLPRRLDPRRFDNRSLQRVLPGQAGFQTFFTERGRAFCLYVVLGPGEDKLLQVRRVEQMLAQIDIEPAT